MDTLTTLAARADIVLRARAEARAQGATRVPLLAPSPPVEAHAPVGPDVAPGDMADTLARAYVREAIGVQVEILRDRTAKDADRLRASEGLLDRGYGKATQAVVTLPARTAAASRLAAMTDADLLAAVAAARRIGQGGRGQIGGPVGSHTGAGPMAETDDPYAECLVPGDGSLLPGAEDDLPGDSSLLPGEDGNMSHIDPNADSNSESPQESPRDDEVLDFLEAEGGGGQDEGPASGVPEAGPINPWD